MGYKMKDLVRNPDLIERATVTTPDYKMVAKKDCKILFPETWVGRELAWIEGDIRILTKFMLVVDGEYTICNECAYIPLLPDSIFATDVDGVPHYELTFSKGGVICPNLRLVVNDTILYYIADEFLTKVRIPPYFEYSDVGKLFLNSNKHSKRELASSNTILELWVATVARSMKDETVQWRYHGKSMQQAIKDRPSYISFKSPVYMANSAMSKISGAYFRDGMASALVSETDVVEPLEVLVRA